MSDQAPAPLTAADHIQLAEALLLESARTDHELWKRDHLVARAQVHATLAVAVSEALSLAVKDEVLRHWQAADLESTR